MQATFNQVQFSSVDFSAIIRIAKSVKNGLTSKNAIQSYKFLASLILLIGSFALTLLETAVDVIEGKPINPIQSFLEGLMSTKNEPIKEDLIEIPESNEIEFLNDLFWFAESDLVDAIQESVDPDLDKATVTPKSYTRDQLRAIAKTNKVPKYSKLSKTDLEKLLQDLKLID